MIRIATAADAEAIARVHVTAWKQTYPGLVPEQVLSGLNTGERASRWTDILGDTAPSTRTVAFVAREDAEFLGFGACGPQRDRQLASQGYAGEISAIYVLRCAQRQGWGRHLMRAMAQNLNERGLVAASLWVLRDNTPARRFYERLGGAVVAEREDRRDERTVFMEVAYGWRDLSLLTGKI